MRFIFGLVCCLACAGVAEAQLFFDDFTRGADPGPLAPWVNQEGTWTVTGGALVGGNDPLNSFAFAYTTNNWTDYSVQARIRFSSTSADAAGIGGRVNPYSGGHYAAWVLPEGSPDGPSTLQIVKFQYWLGYEYTNSTFQPMQTVSLPGVGTNWHTLKLAFQGNRIAVYYDSNLVANVVDVESNPFRSGGAIVNMSTTSTPYTFFVDDFTVSPLPTLLMSVNDTYYVGQNGSLTVPGPGVLGNDTPGSLTNLSAVRLTNPSRGTLTFNSNGGFTYVPSNNFVGVDSFTYSATDGTSNSLPATVAIDVTPSTNIFFDNFTRTGTGNAYAPWVVGLGEWNLTGGVLLGSGTIQDYYSDTYIPGVVGDFTIQTRFQLPSGAWACGLSGRLDPVTGARYVANVYPEGSPLGPTPALRLIKFHSWGTWSSTYTAMALVNLPSVGTSSHTLKLAFYGNTIDVYFDGNRVVHAIDDGVDGLPLYRSGAFGAHMYMYSPYQATFDDLNVSALPPFNFPPVLSAQTNRTIAPMTALVVTNTATDQDIPTNTLTYSLTGPSGSAIDTNGVITWTPTLAQNLTTNVFTTIVTDFCPGATNALHLSATNSFSVVVNNQSAVIVDSTAVAAESCGPTNNAIDPSEAVTVLFALRNTGTSSTTNLVATLMATGGVISPSGPKTYGALAGGGSAASQPFSFTANGGCGSNITATFQLQDGATSLGTTTVQLPLGQMSTILTQNFDSVTAPALPAGWTTSASGAQANWVTQTGSGSTTPNTAFSADASNVGVNELVSPAVALPPGVSQLSFGNFYDLEVNGTNAAQAFDGGVLEIKIGTNAFTDILAAGGSFVSNGYTHTISGSFGNPLGGRQGWSGTSSGFITTLVNLPAAAANQSVQFKWRCGTDNSNGKTGWRVDSVGVSGRACCTAGALPVVVSDTSSLTLEGCAPTNNAVDPGETVTMLLGLKDIGGGNTTNLVATLLATNGVSSPSGPQNYGVLASGGATVSQPFSFTATGACGGTVTATLQLQDGALNLGTVTFPVTLGSIGTVFTQTFDNVTAPALPAGWTTSASGVQSNWVTQTATNKTAPNAAFSPDPLNIGVNELVSPAITLPPGSSQLSFANYYDLEVNNTTEGYDGAVLEIKIGTNAFADILAAGGSFVANGYDHTISTNFGNPLAGRQAWSGTSSGFITTVVSLPAAAAGQSAQLRWRCGTDNGNGRTGWRVDAVGITGRSCCVNSSGTNTPPVLSTQANRTIAELTTLVVTNTATDTNVPANSLSYALQSPPAGATIDSSGVINWTPTEAQGASTNTITTIVTDNGVPPLSATNSFTVVVTEVNTAPTLPSQTNRTIAELTALVVTNRATDTDIPTNILSYALQNPPAGATIDTNGVISWTPTEAQGPSTNTITTIVTDNNIPPLSATNSFTVVVTEVNTAPLLPNQTNRTIAELTVLIVTNTGSDSDIPANTLSYALQNPPAGAVIDTNGVINWTPTEAQGPSTNTITTVVTDNGVPPLSATNSFTVVVTEVNTAPTLPSQINRTIAELTALVVTNRATDTDIPTNILSYALQNPPAGAVIDTNGVINWTPTEAQGPSTNTITTVVTDNGVPSLSATNSFTVVVAEVNAAPTLPNQTNRTIAELSGLIVTNTASDPDIPTNTLSYTLQNPPVGATISSNGVINWTPTEAQGPSTNTITTIVTDNGVPPLSATNSFAVTVTQVNTAPSLPAQTNRTIAELTALVVTNSAADPDIPTNTLSYTLQNPPAGATIDTNGVINWTPTEAQGPGTNTITTIVTDNGIPPLGATNSFTVVVTEVNTTPSLPNQTNRTIAELTVLIVTNTGSDSDIPANTLNYTLQNPPAGATISSNGVINWTPTEAQGPSTNTITTIVTDNGVPSLSATNSFTVTVAEVNTAPSLPAQTNRTIAELTALAVTNSATDTDFPANSLSYTLQNPPAGATISSNGVINWTPSEAQGPSTNTITTIVTDNGVPSLSATNSFTVTVTEVNAAPSLPAQTNRTIAELTALVVTNTATDADVPTNTLTYSLQNPPSGATISSNGVVNWTPTEAQGPTTNTITTIVTDNGVPPLSATNSFTVVVTEVNTAPSLPNQTNCTMAELSVLTVTNTASDSDLPANTLSYTLQNPPAGATISINGVINWTPSEAQGPSINTITTIVTDNGIPPLSATNSFTVTVTEVNTTPSLPTQTNRTIAELTALVVTNTATDADVPTNTLTYSLQNPPAGATIDTNGIIQWTPSEAQGPGTNTITTIVTDDGVPPLSATNSFTVVVDERNSPPALPGQIDQTISGLATIEVTNTATDSDLPANSLSYVLLTAPTNAVIDTNGVIHWTPVVAQVPSTNVFTTVVTDFNPWAINSQHLSATNIFTVVVNPIHNGPSLSAQADRTINELALLTATNKATDIDAPALQLTYQLINPPVGAQIDTNGVITWTPTESQGPGTNTITTVVTDDGIPALSATNSFIVVVDEMNTPPVLPVQTNRDIGPLATLVVTNTATDDDLPVNNLTYAFLAAPTNAVIDTSGVITWTPLHWQAGSTNVFECVVTDDNPWAVNSQHLSATNSFLVTVSRIHDGPALGAQADRTIDELATLIVTNSASDSDVPALTLNYQLINPPAGATIDTNGVISWTPSEAQGPSTNEFTTVVTDSGVPALSATNTFNVVVMEINSPPVLPLQTNRTLNGLATLTVTNTATDADLPANTLAYALLTGPTNAVIDAEGIITWTPALDQIPGTNVFETIVTDDNPWAINSQHLSATNSFTVVTEIHSAPALSAQSDLTIDELATLIVTNAASAFDLPPLSLTYQLINPPTGASIDTNGLITWTVSEAQGPSTNIITTLVTDSGVPPLTATNTFIVVVNELNSPPVLPVQNDRIIIGLATLIVTNAATDADIPVNALSYTLLTAPTNAAIDTNGVIIWTPTMTQVPSTNIFETVVTDFNPWAINAQHLSATNQFTVVVDPIHAPPALPVQSNRTILELATLMVTNAASANDIPPLPLVYQLAASPSGASIDTNGVITWTPATSQCPTTNIITTIVSDGPEGSGLSATNSFLVFVQPPVITIESITVSNGVATVTWTTVVGLRYRVQYKDDPLDTNWTDLLPDIKATGASAIATNGVATSTQRFYRVYLVP